MKNDLTDNTLTNTDIRYDKAIRPDIPIITIIAAVLFIALFTKIAREVKKMSTKKGIFLLQYIDDWLNRALSRLAVSKNTEVLVQLI